MDGSKRRISSVALNFSEHGKDPIEAASMRIGIQICHGINGDRDIVSMFKCLACLGAA
jgi:hypothetical protein